MNKPSPLLSICIPTYNADPLVKEVIDNILPSTSQNIELIIVDDHSENESWDIICEYSHHEFVNVYRNEANLGMDRNFTRCVEYSNGKYIWFCGQDDFLDNLTIQNVTNIVTEYDLGILFVNFSQYNHDYSNVNFESFMHKACFDTKILDSRDFHLFKTSKEYFSLLKQPPSFLPSVVMQRQYWLQTKVENYFDTYFVQVGVALENMDNHLSGGLVSSYVKGRVPNNGWQQNGSKLMRIMTGDIVAKTYAFNKNTRLPSSILIRDRFRYISNFPFLYNHCVQSGFRPDSAFFKHLKTISKGNQLIMLYFKILMLVPQPITNIFVLVMNPIKKISLHVLSRLSR